MVVHTPILTRYLQCMSIMIAIHITKPMLLLGNDTVELEPELDIPLDNSHWS